MDERPLIGDLGLADIFGFRSPRGPRSEGEITAAVEFGRLNRLRLRGISDAPAPLLPSEGFPHWVKEILRRVKLRYDAVILMTGPVGSSKSTGALRLAEEFARRLRQTFDLTWQLCYTASALMAAYARVKPGQPIVFDEGVRGLLAGDQATKEQKALVQALALVREKGAILIICAPSIFLIAKQVRQGRATLWIHVMGRGVGLVHERVDRIRYVPDNTLGFMRSEEAPYMRWSKFPENSRMWRDYLGIKSLRLDEFLNETKVLLEKKEGRRSAKTKEAPLAEAPPPETLGQPPPMTNAELRRERKNAAARATRARLKKQAEEAAQGSSLVETRKSSNGEA